MKRFRSNLQKICDLCSQQSRMAELELQRSQSAWTAAQRCVQAGISQLEQRRQEINQALPHARQMTIILGMHQHLAAAEDELAQFNHQCRLAEKECEVARKKYQEIHSKVERIERLIEKQREEYRREILLEQQRATDDVSIFRWKQPSDRQETEVSTHG